MLIWLLKLTNPKEQQRAAPFDCSMAALRLYPEHNFQNQSGRERADTVHDLSEHLSQDMTRLEENIRIKARYSTRTKILWAIFTVACEYTNSPSQNLGFFRLIIANLVLGVTEQFEKSTQRNSTALRELSLLQEWVQQTHVNSDDGHLVPPMTSSVEG